MASLLERLREAQMGGDHVRTEELLFANSSAVVALIEAAQATLERGYTLDRLEAALAPFISEATE